MATSPKNKTKTSLTAIFNNLTLRKSRTFPITTSIVGLRDFYVRFCEETTLHGMKHTVVDYYHWLERCLWAVVTVFAFGGAVFCGVRQLSRYYSEPVVVSMEREYRSWSTTFPAVTACFQDRVQVDKAREAIEILWNVTEDETPEKYQYYFNFIELIADVSFRTNLQNFWRYQTDDTVKNVNLLDLALIVHPTFPLKVMISKNDKQVQWVPVMTEMGICLSFNSIYSEYQFLLQDIDWSAEELLKCHYHSGQCYVRIDSVNNAVRYFVHSPFDIPTAISNPTGDVLPGEELVMDFKTIEIQASSEVKQLSLEQRRCRYPDEKLSDNILAYSFGLCQMHCRSRMAVMFCGCRPYFHVKGVLPYGLDVGLLGTAAYYFSKLSPPEFSDVISIFGPDPNSKEAESNPEKVVRCIAHRGASLDAPENTLEAFKYCVEQDCDFIELDVRSSRDGKLVLLHDPGLQRLTESHISNIRTVDWEDIKTIDVAVKHPKRHHYKEVRLCLLDEALEYLMNNKCKMIIDVKGEDKDIIEGIVKTFAARPQLYQCAAVTCFNPIVLYQIRRRDPQIVGALSYRPYCFSAQDYDALHGPNNPRFGENLALHALLRAVDVLHSAVWRWTARWCAVSAVFLHKDIVSPSEIHFWRGLGVRCCGWCVNRPLEKLYWRVVLKAPYLANTLLGETELSITAQNEEKRSKEMNSSIKEREIA